MHDQSVRIKKAANGYEVCVKDPDIVANNRSEKGGWKDPDVSYVFTEMKGVTDFLDKNLDKILTTDDDSYDTTFHKALMEDA